MGQEEFYGEQYGHTPSSSEPINQQYYPDGNHTDPHTHSYKQITCLSTSLKHLPHLLLLPHLLFLFPVFFFFWCILFYFFIFLRVHTHWQFINSKVRCVFLVLDEFCLFILSIFKSQNRFFFFSLTVSAFGVPKFQIWYLFFLYLFVYGIRYRDVCSTYCMCIWLDKKCRFFVFHYWELNECWNDVYKINNTVHLQPPITIGGTLLYLPAALNLIGQTQTSSFRRKSFS